MDDLKGKRVFVTGGTGFIGSNMCERLTEEGAAVTVYDNLSSGRKEFIESLVKKGLKFVRGDLLDKEDLSRAMKKAEPEVVIHFAANPDVALGAKQTDLDLKLGTVATYNTLDEARKNDVKDILFSSSSVVYGVATVMPTPEDYGPLKPISLYGASKLASEGLITSFGHLFNMRYCIFRFANIVGKHSTHGVVFDFVNKLKKDPKELVVLGDGKQRKGYLDVMDCVNGMLYVYQKSRDRENIFNLATDDQISVAEISETVVKEFSPGARIKYTGGVQGWPGDVPNAFMSNKRMKELGFTPRLNSSKKVLENLIRTIKEQGFN